LNRGSHIRAKAPLRDHGRGRRPGAPSPEREIMNCALERSQLCATGRECLPL
jgi:hypothetical protein